MSISRSLPTLITQLSGTAGYVSSNLWYFAMLPDTSGSTIADIGQIIKSAFNLGLVQSVSLPFPQLETESTNLDFNYYSAYKSVGDVTITMLETNLFSSFEYLNNWFNSAYDREAKAFKMGESKRNGMLMYTVPPVLSMGSNLLDSVFGSIPSAIFLFKGMMIKSISQIEANYSSSDLLKITASFAVDKVTPILNVDALKEVYDLLFSNKPK